MSFFKKYTLILLMTFLVIFIIYLSLIEKPISVEVEKIQKGLFEIVVEEDAQVRATEEFIIYTPSDGILPHLKYKEGDSVKKGQLLFQFISDPIRPVVSPIEGTILEVYAKDRQHLMRGTPILKVADTSKKEIMAEILTSQALDIHPMHKVRLSFGDGHHFFQGTVTSIGPKAYEKISPLGIKEQRVKVIMSFNQEDKIKQLGIGYAVHVEIITYQSPNELLIPIGTIFKTAESLREQNQLALFKVIDGRAKLIRIALKKKGLINALINSSSQKIAEGDLLIIYPSSEIMDGSKIKIENSW